WQTLTPTPSLQQPWPHQASPGSTGARGWSSPPTSPAAAWPAFGCLAIGSRCTSPPFTGRCCRGWPRSCGPPSRRWPTDCPSRCTSTISRWPEQPVP
ncbi:MAG: hypothetical protein AVDCRST_MAG76-2311, partial [uncultured Acidimicrobiales bacterium]